MKKRQTFSDEGLSFFRYLMSAICNTLKIKV